MALEGNELMLFQMVKSHLGDAMSLKEVESALLKVASNLKLDPESVDRILVELRSTVSPSSPSDRVPRLFVDWGDMPRVGHQCRPAFTLVCPTYLGRPDIHVTIDRDLDHDASDCQARPKTEAVGLWSFHLAFRMTSQGLDCRPGHYLIELQLAFREVPPGLPRFFRSRIRLHVPSASVGGAGVLEIDGDGQSVVNLQGYDLRQFSKVVLKGGQDGVINLANPFGSAPGAPSPAPEKPSTTFEYELKVDQQKQDRVPTIFSMGKQRAYLDAASFLSEDGKRSIVLARPKISFGRSRDNDVVIRFLPRREENDGYSANISRTHFVAELTPEGIEILDESLSGMEVNYTVVRGRHVISSMFVGEGVQLDLGVTGTVPKKFEMEIRLFGPARNEHLDELEYWDELVCEIAGGKVSRMSRMALDTGIDAVRYDRLTNLRDEESYVHLMREVLIGGSPGKCGILLRESGSHPVARLLHIDRMFWLEPLPGSTEISIDGVVLPVRALTHLSPGMEILFGSELLRFDRPTQLHLE